MIPKADLSAIAAQSSSLDIEAPSKFDLPVDHDDRAQTIKLLSCSRPHMRAFHVNWTSFFLSFWLWFAFTSLLGSIQKTMGLTDSQVWISTCLNMASPALSRLFVGPLLEWTGPRLAQVVILMATAVPVLLGGLADNFAELCVVRFFIGITGASFVCCQVWATLMFSDNVLGAAQATVAGWGNMGASFSMLVMWEFNDRLVGSGVPEDRSWRYTLILPGAVALVWGGLLAFIADDAPRPDARVRVRDASAVGRVVIRKAATKGGNDPNSWYLALQYAASFGIELHLYNSLTGYFNERFGVTPGRAILVTSLFGFFNVFARPLGGVLSDKLGARMGPKGRLQGHAAMLLLEGALLAAFAAVGSLAAALVLLSLLSIAVQAAQGLCFGVVPLVQPLASATVSGVVAAGGALGAAALAAASACGARTETVYGFAAGYIVLASAVPALLINIRGHTTFGRPPRGLQAALDVPGAW